MLLAFFHIAQLGGAFSISFRAGADLCVVELVVGSAECCWCGLVAWTI